MTIRVTFNNELQTLREKIISMAKEAKIAMDHAIDALNNQDIELAKKVQKDDEKINIMEQEINEFAIQLITKQQPVAKDLRKVMGDVKVASDIERIGDLAVNIAKSTMFIGEKPFVKPLKDIPKMAEMTQKMLSEVIDAFENNNLEAAFNISKKDEEVDALHGEILKELMNLMTSNPSAIEQITQLTFITRALERAGDHVTNIAESILFIVKGERKDLNS